MCRKTAPRCVKVSQTAPTCAKVVPTLDGYDIGSPIVCEVSPGVIYPAGCLLRGDGAREAVAGERASFQVVTRDRYANSVQVLGGELSAELLVAGARPVLLEGRELGSGVHSFSYTTQTIGRLKIYVSLRRVPIASARSP